MNQFSKHYFYTWLLKFAFVQLIITLVSLPILIWWGLPLSLASPIGNLIFAPFLTAFLLTSSLIFFTELVGIPNMALIGLLEWITETWTWLLSWGSSSWLVSFAVPSTIMLIVLPLIAIAIVHAPVLDTVIKKCSALLCVLAIAMCSLKLGAPITGLGKLECNKGAITIIRNQKQTVVIDPGVLGRRASATSWVEYTLIPELNKQYGTATIDHLVLTKPGTLLFRAITTLLQKTTVKTIYLVVWDGELSKSGWRAFFTMRREVEKQKIKWVRLSSQPITISLSGLTKLIRQ